MRTWYNKLENLQLDRHSRQQNITEKIYVGQKTIIFQANCAGLLIRLNAFMLKHMMPKFKSFGKSLFAAFNTTLHSKALNFEPVLSYRLIIFCINTHWVQHGNVTIP